MESFPRFITATQHWHKMYDFPLLENTQYQGLNLLGWWKTVQGRWTDVSQDTVYHVTGHGVSGELRYANEVSFITSSGIRDKWGKPSVYPTTSVSRPRQWEEGPRQIQVNSLGGEMGARSPGWWWWWGTSQPEFVQLSNWGEKAVYRLPEIFRNPLKCLGKYWWTLKVGERTTKKE